MRVVGSTTIRAAAAAIIGLLFFVAGKPCQAWTSNRVVSTTSSEGRRRRIHPRSSSTSTLFATSSSSSSKAQDSTAAATRRDARVQRVLQLARTLGPVGSRQPDEEQARLLEAAKELRALSDPQPAQIPLTGLHRLVYSASPGGSSGQLGPFDGRVAQEFVDDSTFINAVELGPLKIALTASREIKNDTTIAVKFLKTRFYLFGNQVAEKEVGGGGAWKMIFAGKVQDTDGREKFVRVMETPSLFVIEQPLN